MRTFAFLPFLFCLLLARLTIPAQNLSGAWQGTLDVQGTALRLVFHLSPEGEGYTATMDSPDQGATGIPVDAATFVDGQLTLVAEALQLQYQGTYQAEPEVIVGTFEQGGLSLPLTLERQVAPIEPETRPQDPTDQPYRSADVTFPNESDDVTLAGTLTLPAEGRPEQVVVLISGSGPQDRNQELTTFNHRTFLVLADYLTRQGIGVLRYDDRGVGQSTGDFASATSEDFARDAAAAVAYLRDQPNLAQARVGLVGHSEGGMVAPMVASGLAEVDFLVLLAAPGLPIDQLMLTQSEQAGRDAGTPEAARQANRRLLTRIYAYLSTHPDAPRDSAKAALRVIFQEELAQFPPATLAALGDTETFTQRQIAGVITPWFRYFIRFDPGDYLRQVEVPVLALTGSLDHQVAAEANLAAIEAHLQAGHNPSATVRQLDGLNHLFQTAQTGAVAEYRQIEETFAPKAMAVIAQWIREQ